MKIAVLVLVLGVVQAGHHHSYKGRDHGDVNCTAVFMERVRSEISAMAPFINETMMEVIVESELASLENYDMVKDITWEDGAGYGECSEHMGWWKKKDDDDDDDDDDHDDDGMKRKRRALHHRERGHEGHRHHHGDDKKHHHGDDDVYKHKDGDYKYKHKPCTCKKTEPLDSICSHTECPSYKILDTDGACGFQKKEISSANWVSTRVSVGDDGDITEDAANKAFMRLFAYIDGYNSDSLKIAMTSPVLTRMFMKNKEEINGAVMSFYLPEINQANPPKPLGDSVYVEEFGDVVVYSRAFGGHSKCRGLYKKHFKMLYEAMAKAGDVNDVLWYMPTIIEYLPPWWPRQRHEVAFIKEVNEKQHA